MWDKYIDPEDKQKKKEKKEERNDEGVFVCYIRLICKIGC